MARKQELIQRKPAFCAPQLRTGKKFRIFSIFALRNPHFRTLSNRGHRRPEFPENTDTVVTASTRLLPWIPKPIAEKPTELS